MARLQLQFLRRISSVAFRGFTAQASHGNSLPGNEQGRIWNRLARGGFLGHFHARCCASIIRTLTTEGGKEGSDGDKPHHSTKIDGGKKYSVAQIDNDGSWRTVWRNAVELVCTPSFFFLK